MNNTTVQREGLCSQMASTLFTVLLSIISLGALIGNSLVIVTFYKTRSLRTSTNYYLVNMAVSYLICACFNWPLYATEGMLTGSEFITEPFASVVCKLGLYFRGISQIVSVLSLVLISVDRYAAIALPLKTTMLCRRNVRLILLFSWILPVVCGLPYLFYTRVVKLNGPVFLPNCLEQITERNLHRRWVCYFLLWSTPCNNHILHSDNKDITETSSRFRRKFAK